MSTYDAKYSSNEAPKCPRVSTTTHMRARGVTPGEETGPGGPPG